jgi:hypothetical protein
MLEAGGCIEHPRDLLAAEHRGQRTGKLHPVELAGHVGAIERPAVEEPQRRYRGVHGRRTEARLALLDLIPAQVFVGRLIGRAAQLACEPGNVSNIDALRGPGQPTHVHIVDQALV